MDSFTSFLERKLKFFAIIILLAAVIFGVRVEIEFVDKDKLTADEPEDRAFSRSDVSGDAK